MSVPVSFAAHPWPQYTVNFLYRLCRVTNVQVVTLPNSCFIQQQQPSPYIPFLNAPILQRDKNRSKWRSFLQRFWRSGLTRNQRLLRSDRPGFMDTIQSNMGLVGLRTVWIFGFRIPVHCLYTLREHLIAFAGAHHVVVMDVKKKEQYVSFWLSLNWRFQLLWEFWRWPSYHLSFGKYPDISN